MAKEQLETYGLTLKDVIDYVRDKNPEQLKAEVDDFVSDIRNICESIDILYREKLILLSMRGFYVTVKITDQERNEDYFVHDIGKSASGKSLMQHVSELIGDDEE